MTKFYMILVRKIIKIPEFVLCMPEKFTKFPNFTQFLTQNAQILHNNCRKNFRGRALHPPSPTPMLFAVHHSYMGKLL